MLMGATLAYAPDGAGPTAAGDWLAILSPFTPMSSAVYVCTQTHSQLVYESCKTWLSVKCNVNATQHVTHLKEN